MEPLEYIARREFFRRTAGGLGWIALGEMVAKADGTDPMLPKQPHYPGKAKSVIFMFMSGAPSQIDLLDPKATDASIARSADAALRGQGSQRRPDSRVGHGDGQSSKIPAVWEVRHGIFRAPAEPRGLRRRFVRDPLVSHRQREPPPAQFLMNTGSIIAGRPCIGSWVLYGLGSECRNLPGFVVMLSSSQNKGVEGGATNWSNGFMPSHFRGVTFRNQGDAVLHLSNPAGVTQEMQRARLDLVRALNLQRATAAGDPEIASRIAAYELAFRMQTAAPQLLDFSDESPATLAAYGIGKDPTHTFGSNCLLARRMVERGVRFVQIYHSSWDDHTDLYKPQRPLWHHRPARGGSHHGFEAEGPARQYSGGLGR